MPRVNNRWKGEIAGVPKRFVNHHNSRGANHPGWKGGRRLDNQGYVSIATGKNWGKYEHVLVAEAALGKPLPSGAVVHHVNENRSDNRNTNLVICEGRSYHALLHMRTRALASCGHADWRLCRYCKVWDAPDNLYICGSEVCHRYCHAAHARDRRRENAR